jgi:hypothetical protein
MTRYLMFLFILTFCGMGFAQEPELSKKEQRKLKKQMKKEMKAEEAEKQAVIVSLMVEYHRFVLEADQLRNRRGTTVNVPSTINYIACDSINGVIQIGSDRYVGLNGVGGITIEGSVVGYEYTFNEKSGSYNVSFNVRSSTGTYDVRMSVYADGRADATVSANWPGKLNYLGNLVPPRASRVYKGTPTY